MDGLGQGICAGSLTKDLVYICRERERKKGHYITQSHLCVPPLDQRYALTSPLGLSGWAPSSEQVGPRDRTLIKVHYGIWNSYTLV